MVMTRTEAITILKEHIKSERNKIRALDLLFKDVDCYLVCRESEENLIEALTLAIYALGGSLK